VSLQCYGGSGTCEDFPAEQYLRDQKIDSLYEGTTHIQALDLFFRKVARDGGATLSASSSEVREHHLELGEGGGAAEERALLARRSTTCAGDLHGHARQGESRCTTSGCRATASCWRPRRLVIGVAAGEARGGRRSRSATAPGRRRAYYDGKVASARFFCREVLPTLARKMVEASRLDLMEVPDDAF
jgi:hypothetical protein